MRVIVYKGQAQRQAGKSLPVVTAADLAAADIVLTTYEVLRRDVNHQPAADCGDRSMRGRKKRYEVRSVAAFLAAALLAAASSTAASAPLRRSGCPLLCKAMGYVVSPQRSPMPALLLGLLTTQPWRHAWRQVLPTPLTRLRWWRVCLDEAQMVESSTAKAAEMACRLSVRSFVIQTWRRLHTRTVHNPTPRPGSPN